MSAPTALADLTLESGLRIVARLGGYRHGTGLREVVWHIGHATSDSEGYVEIDAEDADRLLALDRAGRLAGIAEILCRGLLGNATHAASDELTPAESIALELDTSDGGVGLARRLIDVLDRIAGALEAR